MAVKTITPGETRIGWIGTGVMGSSMVGHLMAAGFSATVYNRSKSKAEPLLAKGAKWGDTPKAVAENSDVVFTIVGYPADVREVTLGKEGTLAGSKSGNVLVDMTTSEPSLAVEIAEEAKKKGVASVDAPVSGGDVGAKEFDGDRCRGQGGQRGDAAQLGQHAAAAAGRQHVQHLAVAHQRHLLVPLDLHHQRIPNTLQAAAAWPYNM